MSDYVPIHGKQYKKIAARVRDFRETHGLEWGIHTSPVKYLCDADTAVVKCVITSPEGKKVGSGLAREVRTDPKSKVNSTSFVENCETSAIGRALASMGYAGSDEYASADEVTSAISQQQGIAINHLVKSLIASYEHNAVGFVDWVESLEESQRQDFYGSGSQGEKTKFKALWDNLYKEGIEILSEYASQMSQFIQELDSSGFNQLWEELTENQRRKVWGQLSVESQTVAKGWREEAKQTKQTPEKNPLEFISGEITAIPTLKARGNQ